MSLFKNFEIKYEKLIDITVWDKKFNGINNHYSKGYKHISAEQLKKFDNPNGSIKLMATGLFDGMALEEECKKFINEGEIITMPSGGTANIKYYNGKFLDSGNLIATSNNVELYSTKYIYYCLMNMQPTIQSYYRGSGVKHPDMNNILNIEIAVPPLEVQDEIVRILDDFTLLSAELKARQKQYKFYTNYILNNVNAEMKELGDVCEFLRGPFGGSLKKECFRDNGYAIYEQQHAIYQKLKFRYFIDENKFEQLKRFEVKSGELIVSCSGTIGKVFVIPENAPQGIINQALLKLRPKGSIKSEYIKYFFQNTLAEQLNNSARGGAIKNVPSVTELKKIKILVPSIEEQEKIICLLNKFEKLYNDSSKGLPAEIEARKKQYEYYRNKLLTFEELKIKEG